MSPSDICENWTGGDGIQTWDREGGLEWFSKKLYDKDLKTGTTGEAYKQSWDDPKYPKQNIVTYTVGFGSGISDIGKEYLIKGASPCSGDSCPSYSYKKGNKTITGSDKLYFNAVEADDLVAAFDQIFNSIKNDNLNGGKTSYSATAPAISSNYVDGLAAAASLNTGSWSSELLFYDVDSNGRLDTDNPKRPTFANRKLLVSDGSNVHLYNNALSTQSNAWYNIPNVTTNTSTNPNRTEWRDGLLKWMARDGGSDAAIKASNANFQLDYRTRPVADAATNVLDQRSMGDIIDNSILAIGSMSNKRQEFVVTSTNDGLVYVFKSSANDSNPYDLKFNYAPTKMERHSNDGSDYVGKYYKDTTTTDYGLTTEKPHRYLLNGGMVARSTDANGRGKQVFMASTMGQAGRGAFAINIGGVDRATGSPIAANNVDTANWHQQVKLFETPTGATNELGFTIGSPQIGRTQINTNATAAHNDTSSNIHYGVFLGNGYNYNNNYQAGNQASNDTPTLYIYDALGQDVGLNPNSTTFTKGELLKKFTITDGSGGLATPTLVDSNFDGVIDYAYAGDFGGGLYRFDLTSPNSNNWTVNKIFQTPDNRPITSAPAIHRKSISNYTVMVGTGSEIYQEDLASKTPQALYAIFDDTTITGPAANINPAYLLEQQLTSGTVNSPSEGSITVRKVTNNAIVPDRHKGWMVNLDANSGERVTVKPSVMGNTLLLTTRVYEQTITSNTGDDPCLAQTQRASSSAYSWIMQLSTSNGGLMAANNKSVYTDFNLGDQSKFSLSGSQEQYMISGRKLDNLTSLTLIDKLMEGFSVSTSGDSGGTGEDPILNPNAITPRNDCVGDGSKAFTFDTQGSSETYDIYGSCNRESIAFKRLSWREIF